MVIFCTRGICRTGRGFEPCWRDRDCVRQGRLSRLRGPLERPTHFPESRQGLPESRLQGCRAKFGTPEALLGKQVCATGVIKIFRGKPQIILTDPSQLTQK
jgi:hypothetical protein